MQKYKTKTNLNKYSKIALLTLALITNIKCLNKPEELSSEYEETTLKNNTDKEFLSLKNDYFIDFKNKSIIQYNDEQINNLKKNLKSKKKEEKIKIIKTIKEINRKIQNISKFQLFENIDKRGVYIKEENKKIELIKKPKDIITKFKLFENLTDIKQNQLENISNKLDIIIQNLSTNKLLYEKKIMKEDYSGYFISTNGEPKGTDLDKYSTIKELINDNNKAYKLLVRGFLINDLNKLFNIDPNTYSGNIKDKSIQEQIIILRAKWIAKANNKKEGLILNSIQNKQPLDVKSLLNLEQTNIKTYIETTSKGSVIYYNKTNNETIFNTIKKENLFDNIDNDKLTGDDDLKLIFQTVIKTIEEVYKLKQNETIKTNLSKLQPQNFEDFIRKYLNINNKENISHYLGEQIIKYKTNPKRLKQLTELMKYLNGIGLQLDKKAEESEKTFKSIIESDQKLKIEITDNKLKSITYNNA